MEFRRLKPDYDTALASIIRDRLIEAAAKEMGYRRIYLETHANLQAAIHIYEKEGYSRIERPETVVHSTMNRFFLKELQ